MKAITFWQWVGISIVISIIGAVIIGVMRAGKENNEAQKNTDNAKP